MSRIEREKNNIQLVKRNSVGRLVKLVSAVYSVELKKALAPYDLSIGEFPILMTLLEQNNLSQSEIGQHISMPGYAMTRSIDTLEAKGLVVRNENKTSRRSHCITLTSKGEKLAPNLVSAVQMVNNTVLTPLTAEEIDTFETTLRKLLP